MNEQTDEYWRKKLTPEQYQVMRQQGTEMPFSGAWLQNEESGVYKCAGCAQELFKSDAKFDSHSGWPSFSEASNKANVLFRADDSYGMRRTEVLCKNCGAHLGHMFESYMPGSDYYCINSVCLDFEAKKDN